MLKLSMYPQQPQYPQIPPVPQGQPSPSRRKEGFLLPFIVAVMLAVIFIGLFIWAYMGMQDYKNNVQAKIDAASTVARQEESSRKDNEFNEKEKSPLKTFKGPDTYGGITFAYPKTWSAYLVQSDKGGTHVDGYFHPDVVPDVESKTAYALRVRVVSKPYDQHVKTFESKIKQGKLTLAAYAPKNQPAIIGAKITGEVNTGQKNHMVVLPLRDKTIEISTESEQFKADFEKIILETLNFTP